MSRRFKAVFLWMVLLWAFLPQLACFLPEFAEDKKTSAECCQQMPEHCGKKNMPAPSGPSAHACCQHIMLAYVVATVKAEYHVDPPMESAVATLPTLIVPSAPDARTWLSLFIANMHAPPNEAQFPLNLRI